METLLSAITITAVCVISKGMDSHIDIPDDTIKTNDPSVDINRLRPEHLDPVRTKKPNFKV